MATRNAAPRNPEFERGGPIPGYSRIVLRVVWWNVFHVCVLIGFFLLAASGQGAELLEISREQERSLLGAAATAVLPLALFVLVVTLSSFVTGRAGTWQLDSLCQAYKIDLGACKRFAQVYVPVGIGLVPSLAIAILNRDMLWFLLGLAFAGLVVVLITRFRNLRAVQRLTLAADKIKVFPLWGLVVGALGMAIAASIAIATFPNLARKVGTLGVMLVALGTWSALLTLLLVALPIKLRFPSLAALVPLVWVAMVWHRDPNLFPRGHSWMGPVAQAPAAQRLETDQAAFMRWLLKFDENEEMARIPVFLVSAEGGGIRSAYWTARALAEVNARSQGRFGKHIFALSGVSGGSLGVVAFRETIANKTVDPVAAIGQVESLLGRDYLAPLAARTLVTEPLWHVFGIATPRDISFERQLAADWGEVFGTSTMTRPFLDAFPRGGAGDAPLVILNATNVESGRRVLLSNMSIRARGSGLLAPFADARGLDAVMPLVTVAEAVHLSARFPYLSPPASLVALIPDGKGASVPRIWGRVVDGGYFDNSGADGIAHVLRNLMDVRAAAQIQEATKTPATNSEWEKARRLARKVVFRVVVVRNDPHANMSTDASGIPSLSHASTRRLSDADLKARFENGGLMGEMPAGSPMSEIVSPPETILSAREARGIASRHALAGLVMDGKRAEEDACEWTRRLREEASSNRRGEKLAPTQAQAVLISSNCAGDDRYLEISLADEIIDAQRNRLNAQPGCSVAGVREDVALGWVLSSATRRSMSCLAGASEDVVKMIEYIETTIQ